MSSRIAFLGRCLIMFFGLLFFMIGVAERSVTLMNYAVMLQWISNICFCAESFYDRIYFFAFQITFFTFLMGRTAASIFSSTEDYYGFSQETLFHTAFCLYIALLSVLVGYRLFSLLLIKKRGSKAIDYESDRYKIIRRIALVLFWTMLPFSLLVTIEKAAFVRSMGYASYYVSYRSQFPYFVTKFGDICPLAFYIFLSTMPSKREVRFPMLVFTIRAVLLMFTGKRADFVVPVLLLLLYFASRNDVNSGGEPWLTKRHLRMVVLAVPLLLLTLYSYNTIRFENSSSSRVTLSEGVIGFFEDTGFSVNVISFEKDYESIIPNKIYSFGDTTDYVRENVLTQLFFDFPVYRNQTAEKALYGNNFSQTITYLHSPSYYLSGRGYGSCYIAEAYHDFGYPGVVLWSMIYAYMLARVYSFKGKGIVYVTLALQALHYILLAPRNMASAFISEYVNINTWLVLAAVYMLSFVLHSRKRDQHSRSFPNGTTVEQGLSSALLPKVVRK